MLTTVNSYRSWQDVFTIVNSYRSWQDSSPGSVADIHEEEVYKMNMRDPAAQLSQCLTCLTIKHLREMTHLQETQEVGKCFLEMSALIWI